MRHGRSSRQPQDVVPLLNLTAVGHSGSKVQTENMSSSWGAGRHKCAPPKTLNFGLIRIPAVEREEKQESLWIDCEFTAFSTFSFSSVMMDHSPQADSRTTTVFFYCCCSCCVSEGEVGVTFLSLCFSFLRSFFVYFSFFFFFLHLFFFLHFYLSCFSFSFSVSFPPPLSS